MHIILERHLLYACHIVIIYCTHCSITLRDCVMLLVKADLRLSRNTFRMGVDINERNHASHYIYAYFYITILVRAGENGLAAPVLPRPVFLKVKVKSIFRNSKY